MNGTETSLLELSRAALYVTWPDGAGAGKAVAVLREEMYKRTGVWLEEGGDSPSSSLLPAIVLSFGEWTEHVPAWCAPLLEGAALPGAEGFRLASGAAGGRAVALVAGADARGLLYGVGKLLRLMRLTPGAALLPDRLRLSETPAYALRGHQLGYRPKTNAYDAWSPEQFEQYIRELAIFGANSIELVPPRTDDDETSVHMKVPAPEMMARLSRTIDEYGLDVWVWYPNMADDYSDPDTRRAELAERGQLFASLHRIDHILMPSGDPGRMELDVFFSWASDVAALLRTYHPQAKLWFAPQHPEPTDAYIRQFAGFLNSRPEWLGGAAHGPWVRLTVAQLREALDPGVAIRNYPDITHTYACQFPVPNLDPALALTYGRECINPRPLDMKLTHNRLTPFTSGSLTYSEGIYDDVNKFVWGAQDWNPHAEAVDTLVEYARLFISARHAELLAHGLLALERNWQEPLAACEQVETTLRHWLDLEEAEPGLADNYRFQLALMRACCDAYVRRRLLLERALERCALEALENAPHTGALAAMDAAEALLLRAETERPGTRLRRKIDALADALYASIGAQPTVERHHAQAWYRGAFLEDIDRPLNDADWLLSMFAQARALADEDERQALLRRVCRRTDPGPGGFYDSLGSSMSRVVNPARLEEAPDFSDGAFSAFCMPGLHAVERGRSVYAPYPIAWLTQAMTYYTAPLVLEYRDLDPEAQYTLRVTYNAFVSHRSGPMRLEAGDGIVLAERITVKRPFDEQCYIIPRAAVRHGILTVMWRTDEGRLGPYAAEVWLQRRGNFINS